MIRSIKLFGLGMLAALAMSAAAAPTASAVPLFHSEFAGVTLTGTQVGMAANTLTIDQGQLKCNVATFSGVQGAMTTTTMTLKPHYTECQLAGEAAAVTINGCRYTFHLEEQLEPIEARMGIECPVNQVIVIDTAVCTVTIPAQQPRQTVTFTNEGAGTTRAVVADLNVSGLDYVEHGAGCASQTQTTENGIYTGQITVKAEAGEEHVGLWAE